MNSNSLSPQDAADLIGCKRNNIYPKVKEGKLEALQDKPLLVSRSSVDRYISERDATKNKPHPAAAKPAPEISEVAPVRKRSGRPAKKQVFVTAKPVVAAVAETKASKKISPAPAGELESEVPDPKTEERRVPLNQIQFDPELQTRAEINESVVVEYAESMKGQVKFPPVQLFAQDGLFYIGDGWHRLRAAKELGYSSFPAVINPGGRTAALRFALAANASHGMPRTQADKNRAVSLALREYPKVSGRAIARICAVSESFVRAFQKDRCAQNAPEKRVGADGKLYPTKSKRKGLLADPQLRQQIAEKKVRVVCETVAKLTMELLVPIKQAVEQRISQLSTLAEKAPTTPTKDAA